jgi:hypothetical protein
MERIKLLNFLYSRYKRGHNIHVCCLRRWRYLLPNTPANLIRPGKKEKKKEKPASYRPAP